MATTIDSWPPRSTGLIEPCTARLQLRQWRASDRAPFAALNADPDVMRYFPAPLTRAQSDAMADKIESLFTQQGWGMWAVTLRSTGAFAGFVGLHVPAAALPFQPCVEIAWRLARPAWGQGMATEAATAALAVAFGPLHLPEVVSFTTRSNLPSQAVMQRLGMVRDLAGDFLHPDLPAHHPLQPHVLYRLSAPQRPSLPRL